MTSIPRADEPSLIDEPSVVHALRVTLVIFFASALVISAVTLFLRWRLTPQLALVAGASSLVALVLSRSGRIRPAMMLPLLFITYAVLTLAVRSDGIQNIGLAILPVLILVGSLVLDRLTTLVFFTASIILAVVGMLAIRYFVLLAERYSTNDMGDLFIFAITCTTAALVGRLFALRIKDGFRRAQAYCQALSQAERNVRLATDSLSEMVVAYDMRRSLTYANKAAERLTGYGHTELQVADPLSWTHPEDRSQVLALWDKAFDGQTVDQVVYRLITKDGTVKWAAGSWGPVVDEKGHQVGVRGTCLDITERVVAEEALQETTQKFRTIVEEIAERKRVEQALRESEERTRLAMEAGRMFAFEWSPLTDEVRRSYDCSAITGSTSDATVEAGRESLKRVHPDDQERLIQTIGSLTPANDRYEIEYRVIRPGGQIATLQQSSRAFFDSSAVMIRLIGITADITQRKQAEDNLREALRQLQLITDNMATGVTRCSLDLRYVWVSRSYAAWLGRTPEEIAGRSIIEVLGPEYYEVIRPRIEKVLSGERVEYEAPVNSPGIGTGWIHAVYVPTKDRNNKVDGWIAVVTDVTERHETEERLRASEARLIEAQHLAKVGSWERHIDGDTIHWSDEMLRILGLSDSAPSSLSAFLSCVHPKDREKILEVDAKVRSGIAPVEVEYRIIRPNGETRLVRSIVEAIRNDQGLPVRIAGATQDITEQVRAAETLRESEAHLKNAERIAHVGNWHWEISVNHVTCSEETLRILGSPQDYTSGFEGFLQTVIPQDRERVYQWGKDCLKEKRGNSMEFQIARSNGDLRTVSCTCEVLLNEDGLPVHMVGTCQDVTDSRRAEAASRRSRDEIAHLNRVGAMGELAASLAHELNQPLAAILLNSQAASRFLSGQPPNLARVGDCLNRIAVDGDRAGEVIQRLRGLLKKGESQASLVDLNEVVSDALRLVGNDVLLRQVSVNFEPLPSLPPVLGDRIQLYQVVLNLIVNGLEAVAERPLGDRWVSVRTAEADGGGIELTVEDSGKGITEGDLARVFEPFFTTKPEGLGMGLSISRSIVEAHGGRIWAERSAGRGAIFHCVVPVAQQAAVAAAK